MSDLMAFVQTAFESPLNSIITIILFIAAIRGIYEMIKWVKGELNTWYQNKHTAEEKDQTLEERIDKLEEDNNRQFEKLESIDATLQNVTATLEVISNETAKRLDDLQESTKKHFEEIDKNSKRRSVIANRSTLYQLHREFMKKESITLAERQMFDAVSAEYLACGGNSVFKNKIIPEVEALPIKD